RRLVFPDALAVRDLHAPERAGRLVGIVDEVAVTDAEVSVVAFEDRRAPDRQLGRHPPELFTGFGIDAEDRGFLVNVADAAATVNAIADHRRRRVHVHVWVIPHFFAGDGAQAVEPIVTGADEDLAVDHGRARFRVALGEEFPVLLAGGGVETVELALLVLMVA